ncbi:MAG: aminoglycoside phosphotransferase family protein [Gemmatimonadales bacterium]
MTETQSAWLVFGKRLSQRVVLKVAREPGDEWLAGSVIAAFDGHGMVRAMEWTDGAVLLEEIRPADPLVNLARAGRDSEASAICARVIASMTPGPAPSHVPTAADWGRGFERYAASRDGRIPPDLLAQAHDVYTSLVGTQTAPKLLHGDLHHYNILVDSWRGWLAVDPKGVVAELEFELGAWLRNPVGHPELFAQPAAVDQRLQCLRTLLPIQPSRTLRWAFAQGVLSGIWTLEDSGTLPRDHAGLALAYVLRENHGVLN